MTETLKFPLTMQELATMGPEPVRFPATWDEYWELLPECEYRIEFQNNEIIAMSYEPNPHSKIVSRIIGLFDRLFDEMETIEIHNSNRPVYIEEDHAVFNPDASVVQLPSKLYEYQSGMNAEMTPILIVEVLSPGTRRRDLKEKLPSYKKIDSLRHILYVETTHPMIFLYQRDTPGAVWKTSILDEMEMGIELNGQLLTLKDIYRRIAFLPEPDEIEQ